jgi:hypothetical protein
MVREAYLRNDVDFLHFAPILITPLTVFHPVKYLLSLFALRASREACFLELYISGGSNHVIGSAYALI